MARRVHPSLAELLDRLSIDLIKQVARPDESAHHAEEIAAISADLDQILGARNARLTGRAVRLLVALAQINLHIWQAKERMLGDRDAFESEMSLAHQLNGIRNSLKVALLSELEGDGALGPTNTSREDLEGWVFSILDEEERADRWQPKSVT